MFALRRQRRGRGQLAAIAGLPQHDSNNSAQQRHAASPDSLSVHRIVSLMGVMVGSGSQANEPADRSVGHLTSIAK